MTVIQKEIFKTMPALQYLHREVIYHDSPLVRWSSPILTDSKTLCNSLLYMPELTTSNILFFLHLLRPETPYTLMLPARTLCCRLNMPSVTSCIRSLRLVFVVGVVCCFVRSFD